MEEADLLLLGTIEMCSSSLLLSRIMMLKILLYWKGHYSTLKKILTFKTVFFKMKVSKFSPLEIAHNYVYLPIS